MIGFRLTIVLISAGRVTSATAFIMGIGPIASTWSIGRPSLMSSWSFLRHESLLAVTAVVCHQEDFVAGRVQFFFQDEQFLCSSSDDANDMVARLFHGNGRWVSDRRADTATNDSDGAKQLDVRRFPQWTDHILD